MSSARRQERIDELCAASIRALAGDAALRLHGWALYRGAEPLPAAAPHLQPEPGGDDLAALRGVADGLGLRSLHTDLALHERLAPPDEMARRLFDLLEQYRVESLTPQAMRGLQANLARRHDAWCRAFVEAGLTEAEQGLAVFAVAQMARARVLLQPMDAQTEDLLEATRIALAPRIGDALARLRGARHDQAAYAQAARVVAERVAALLRQADEGDARGPRNEMREQRRQRLGLWLQSRAVGDRPPPVAGFGVSRILAATGQGYRVFTTAYDQQADAASLVRAEELQALREQLDRQIAERGINVARLAHELRQRLAVPAVDDWVAGQEEGRIDGRRLAQMVASPAERRIFKQERWQPQADAVVAFLLDCSGSMKQHAPRVALLVDVLARALEQAGVASEVLGYTTRSWNGGRALRDWMRAGRPAHPGRLNEAQHLVFKEAERSWRRSRRGIAALLKPDLYREGIDGEAIDWACARLRARPEPRRILVTVSDGSPMDSATARANDEHYLDEHLRAAVMRQCAVGDVEIVAVGVGLSLSPYYPRHRVLDVSQPAGQAMCMEVARLLPALGQPLRG